MDTSTRDARRLTVHARRGVFCAGAVEIPVASPAHIVETRAKARRPKDRLFLATHADALRGLLPGGGG